MGDVSRREDGQVEDGDADDGRSQQQMAEDGLAPRNGRFAHCHEQGRGQGAGDELKQPEIGRQIIQPKNKAADRIGGGHLPVLCDRIILDRRRSDRGHIDTGVAESDHGDHS